MAFIEYIYEDRNNHANDHAGEMWFSFIEFAHSLLCLNGKMSFFQSVQKWLSASLAFFSDFTINGDGQLRKKRIDFNAYDGIKKSAADICGAAITIHVARTKFNLKHVIPISESMVSSTTGKRPDFVATDGTQYSLFESKASINQVRAKAISDGLTQLNSVASINHNGKIINNFREKVLVSTDLNHTGDHVCCGIIDPDEKGDVIINFSLVDGLKEYYHFVKKIIDSNECVSKRNLFDRNITLSKFETDELTIELGMITDLYECCEFDGLSLQTINRALDFHSMTLFEENYNETIFEDGVYIKVQAKSDDYYDLILANYEH